MVTTGLRHILGAQWESSGAVNSLFPIPSAWKSGPSRERQDRFQMWRHCSLRVLSLLRIALLAPWWGHGHQHVTEKRSYGYISKSDLWDGLTTTMLNPGLFKGRGRWWSDHRFSTLSLSTRWRKLSSSTAVDQPWEDKELMEETVEPELFHYWSRKYSKGSLMGAEHHGDSRTQISITSWAEGAHSSCKPNQPQEQRHPSKMSILVTIWNHLMSSPLGTVLILRLSVLQKTRKFHCVTVQHQMQEASFLCGAFGRYHYPNNECHFCVYLPFDLSHTLIANRFS